MDPADPAIGQLDIVRRVPTDDKGLEKLAADRLASWASPDGGDIAGALGFVSIACPVGGVTGLQVLVGQDAGIA